MTDGTLSYVDAPRDATLSDLVPSLSVQKLPLLCSKILLNTSYVCTLSSKKKVTFKFSMKINVFMTKMKDPGFLTEAVFITVFW